MARLVFLPSLRTHRAEALPEPSRSANCMEAGVSTSGFVMQLEATFHVAGGCVRGPVRDALHA